MDLPFHDCPFRCTCFVMIFRLCFAQFKVLRTCTFPVCNEHVYVHLVASSQDAQSCHLGNCLVKGKSYLPTIWGHNAIHPNRIQRAIDQIYYISHPSHIRCKSNNVYQGRLWVVGYRFTGPSSHREIRRSNRIDTIFMIVKDLGH